ncbi:MAG: hypothetical protein ACT4NX_06370 [Deltaproteobacteria bacterium]
MTKLTALALFIALCLISGFGLASAEESSLSAANASGRLDTHPLRSVCAYIWNAEYKKDKVEIAVSTRGDSGETVVFTCPECSLEEHFVNPFLDNEYRGKTGIERVRECGFAQAVFKGGRGIVELVRAVGR